MAEVDLEIRLRTAKTIAEIEAVKKQALSLSKNLVLGTKEQESAERALVATKQRLEDISGRLATTNGKLMKSYFSAGEELRRFYREQRLGDRVMGDATKSVQSFTSILGGTEISNAFNTVVNNFQTLEFGIKGASVAAEGAGGKMATFGSVLNGLSMPLALVGGGLMFAVNQMKELEKASEDAGKRLKEAMNQAALNKMGGDPKKLYDLYKKQRDESERMMKKYQALYLRSQAQANDYTVEGRYHTAAAEHFRAQYKDAATQYQQYQNQMDQSGYSPLGVPVPVPDPVELTPDAPKTTKPGDWKAYRTRSAIGKLTGQGTSISQWSPGRIKMGVQGTDLANVETKVQGINQNVKTIGTTLANSLAEGFTRGFQTGENMLQTFAQSVLASIMGIAAQQTAILGISGILSLIPGVGAFGAIAGAMGSMFFNTSSGASASPISGMDVTNGRSGVVGELRGVKNAVQNLSLRVDNQGIYMASVRGEAAFTRA